EADCSDPRSLTRAEMEGRRQVRAIMDIVNRHVPGAKLGLLALPARIGIRQTRHVRCLHQLTGDEVLHGRRFDDAIANGSYRVDIHHAEKPGLTFRYLDGREVYVRPGHPAKHGRWRADTGESPTFYQIPYRSLVPQGPYGNLLAAGRFIDADQQAHGAIRVMVNMNQTGEAAGAAAWLALKHQTPAAALDPALIRRTLSDGGSLVL
ncbi:MAG: FAD-dependent oxidoreductase, partial [Verrucomicrobiota bacterium]